MDDGLRPNLDIRTFSNDLGKHFVQKIDTIRTQLDTNQQSDSYPEDDTPSAAQQTDSLPEDDIASAVLDETVSSFATFTMLSVRDVKQLIQNSVLKSCPLNPMPIPHWLANVSISFQFSQKSLTHYSLGVFRKFGKRL